jgi:flagellar motor switch protein FliG
MEDSIVAEPTKKMSRHQQLAALLVILGPESAAQLLNGLDEDELEIVSLEMAGLTRVTEEMRSEVLQEFSELVVEAGTGIWGGVTYTRSVLEKSIGVDRASEIINRLSPAPMPLGSMRQIVEMDLGQLYNLLKDEPPQTIALVASYLPPKKTSHFLTRFPTAKRDQIVERLATLGPTPIEVVESVGQVLGRKTNSKSTRALNQTGGLRNAADVLSAMDRNVSDPLLSDLERRNPDLAQAVRGQMSAFL